ncbi:MAG: hypothetical protein LBN95_11730 [Prevotellaceae bacterium]|nr:hypothetical protein [Prevotellaceae bacterium]
MYCCNLDTIDNKDSLRINSIDTIDNAFYIIEVTKHDSVFKIVSCRCMMPDSHSIKIKVGNYYKLNLIEFYPNTTSNYMLTQRGYYVTECGTFVFIDVFHNTFKTKELCGLFLDEYNHLHSSGNPIPTLKPIVPTQAYKKKKSRFKH